MRPQLQTTGSPCGGRPRDPRPRERRIADAEVLEFAGIAVGQPLATDGGSTAIERRLKDSG